MVDKQQKSDKRDDGVPPASPPNKPPMLEWKPIVFTLFIFFVYYFFLQQQQPSVQVLPYSEFKQAVYEERIASVVFKGESIQGKFNSASASNVSSSSPQTPQTKPNQSLEFKTIMPSLPDPELLPLLQQAKVTVSARADELPVWASVIISLLPWILIFGFFVFSNRMLQSKMGGGTGGLFGFGKSKARLYEKAVLDIGFDEVAGLENAKHDLREVIQYLKDPSRFRRLGAKLPKGLLMMGPPGTGKTLLARATAAEAGVPFFSISGSEFVEMFVGVGASRVRDMFEEARKRAPALIFVDEIDSVGRVRGSGVGGGNDEREQTLNQILAEMDGFSSEEPIVVIAATNRPDVLDPALLRPGRFDRKVTLDLPQRKARGKILAVHLKGKPASSDIDIEQLASRTIGFSGADIENLVNEAALHAVGRDANEINQIDFEYAHDKILLGAVSQDIINETDKARIAYHESGHALAAWHLKTADPLSKVTIIPRGRSLGMTESMPSEDRVNYTEDYLAERLCVLLGGRCSELLIYGQASSGAADDLKQCTKLARKMVTQWGMNKHLGPVNFPQHEEHPFLGMEMAQPKEFSDYTARQIDEEVAELIKASEAKTFKLLEQYRADLDKLASNLIENETLDADMIQRLIGDPEH